MVLTHITRIGIAVVAALALGTVANASDWPSDVEDQLRLNTSITVTDDAVRLGDIFSGFLSRPEKVVTRAPRPGQKMVLSAKWLSNIARTYGLDWTPANQYDRAIVFQPGQTISTEEILNAVETELSRHGLPESYGIRPKFRLNPVTIAMDAPNDIRVREAFFDAASQTFSAVVEIPPGTPDAQFIPIRGDAFPTATIPVLTQNMGKNAVISENMIKNVSVPLSMIGRETITDGSYLLGKAPLTFIQAGKPIDESDVAQITLVDIPVLTVDMHRDSSIGQTNVAYETFDAAKLPADVIMDADQLIGKTPRRYLAAGAPVRRGDVVKVHLLEVPVANRGMPRGTLLTDGDISWVTVNDTNLAADVVTDETDIIGFVTRHTIRPGQILRSHNVERPKVIARGALVTIVWDVPMMSLSTQGQASQAGGIGDIIRVVNTSSKTAIFAEVVGPQKVRVTSQQMAMQ